MPKLKLPILVFVLAFAGLSIGSALAAVSTDKTDYSPGSVVTISGSGYDGDISVDVSVSGPNGYSAACSAAVTDGAWSCQVTLSADDSAAGTYTYTAVGSPSGKTEVGTFTDHVHCTNDTCRASPIDLDNVPPNVTGGSQTAFCETDTTKQNEWHFVLNGLNFAGHNVNAPATMTANFTSGDVSVSMQAGKTATDAAVGYTLTTNLTDTLTDGHATLLAGSDDGGTAADTFKGTFVLSHAPCGEGGVTKASSIATEIHLGSDHTTNHDANNGGTSVALGSTVHEKWQVDVTPSSTAFTGTVDTFFWKNGSCDGTADDSLLGQAANGTGSVSADSVLPEGPLHAGDYSYRSDFTSTTTGVPDAKPGSCEKVHVNKAQLGITTDIHNASHLVVTAVSVGQKVHDTAAVTGQVGLFVPSGAVTFTFDSTTTSTCGTTAIATAGAADAGNGNPRSIDTPALVLDSYGFKGAVAGDDDYLGATSDCEPLAVYDAGTRGYWGNRNGNAKLDPDANGSINTAAAFPGLYNIGNMGLGGLRGAHVQNIDCSNAILGSDSTGFIAMTGAGTAAVDNACENGGDIVKSVVTTLAAGITTTNIVANLGAQNLALTYNIALKAGFSGNTLTAIGCDPALFGGFTATTSSVPALRAALAGLGVTGPTTTTAGAGQLLAISNTLLDGTTGAGPATMVQVEAMTQLLGRCVNQ